MGLGMGGGMGGRVGGWDGMGLGMGGGMGGWVGGRRDTNASGFVPPTNHQEEGTP